jgi:hypothetical protein
VQPALADQAPTPRASKAAPAAAAKTGRETIDGEDQVAAAK